MQPARTLRALWASACSCCEDPWRDTQTRLGCLVVALQLHDTRHTNKSPSTRNQFIRHGIPGNDGALGAEPCREAAQHTQQGAPHAVPREENACDLRTQTPTSGRSPLCVGPKPTACGARWTHPTHHPSYCETTGENRDTDTHTHTHTHTHTQGGRHLIWRRLCRFLAASSHAAR